MSVRHAVAIFSVGHFLAFIDRTMVAGALPLIRRHLSLSTIETGWVIGTAFALAYGATALLVASRYAATRFGTRRRLIAGVIVWSLASLGTGLVATVSGLLAMRALLGVGQALFIPAALSWIVDAARVRREPALAAFTISSTVGRSTALLLVGSILALLGLIGINASRAQTWLLFALSALPNVLLLATLLLVRIDDVGIPPPTRAGGSPWSTWFDRAPFLIAALMPLMLVQAVAGWLPTLFVDERGMSPATAATWLGTATIVGSPLSQLIGSWLMTRDANRAIAPKIVLAATLGAVPLLVLVGWAPTAAMAIVAAALLVLVLGVGTFAALVGFQELVSTARREADNGVYLALVTVVGLGVGPLLTGMIVPLISIDGALRVALLATGAIAAALCAVSVWRAQPRFERWIAA